MGDSTVSHCKIHDTYPEEDEPCWQCIRCFGDENLQAEVESLSKKCDELLLERDAALQEIDQLKAAMLVYAQGTGKRIECLVQALLQHRWDLHERSDRPCPTCKRSAEALGLKVPGQCAREKWDEQSRKEKERNV